MTPGAECIKADGQGHNSSYGDHTLDYAKEYGNFCAAEMKEPIIMRQSYDNVPAGTYTITAQAFVSNDDNDITNERNIAYLFASNGQAGGTPDGALIPILDGTDQANFTDNYYKNMSGWLTPLKTRITSVQMLLLLISLVPVVILPNMMLPFIILT